MGVPVVPPYTPAELAERIANGSLDLPRLASTLAATANTVVTMQQTVKALAEWVNKQIQGTADAKADADTRSASRRR